VTPRPLTRTEIAALAVNIRALLADPDSDLSPSRRTRWEGALTALEYVLGQVPTLIEEDPERFIL
jgi:hypothetical protein